MLALGKSIRLHLHDHPWQNLHSVSIGRKTSPHTDSNTSALQMYKKATTRRGWCIKIPIKERISTIKPRSPPSVCKLAEITPNVAHAGPLVDHIDIVAYNTDALRDTHHYCNIS
jgi:hypothetical protein